MYLILFGWNDDFLNLLFVQLPQWLHFSVFLSSMQKSVTEMQNPFPPAIIICFSLKNTHSAFGFYLLLFSPAVCASWPYAWVGQGLWYYIGERLMVLLKQRKWAWNKKKKSVIIPTTATLLSSNWIHGFWQHPTTQMISPRPAHTPSLVPPAFLTLGNLRPTLITSFNLKDSLQLRPSYPVSQVLHCWLHSYPHASQCVHTPIVLNILGCSSKPCQTAQPWSMILDPDYLLVTDSGSQI